MALALIRKDGSYLHISDQKYQEWVESFPGLDVKEQIEKANSWLSTAPLSKNWKSIKGFERWLKTTFENSPRIKADKRTSGVYSHIDRVQREEQERQANEAKAQRLGEEQVREIFGQLKRDLDFTPKPEEPVQVSQLRCRHEWSKAWTGGMWCPKCGMWPEQWRAV